MGIGIVLLLLVHPSVSKAEQLTSEEKAEYCRLYPKASTLEQELIFEKNLVRDLGGDPTPRFQSITDQLAQVEPRAMELADKLRSPPSVDIDRVCGIPAINWGLYPKKSKVELAQIFCRDRDKHTNAVLEFSRYQESIKGKDSNYTQNPIYQGRAMSANARMTRYFKSWLEAGSRYQLLGNGTLPDCANK